MGDIADEHGELHYEPSYDRDLDQKHDSNPDSYADDDYASQEPDEPYNLGEHGEDIVTHPLENLPMEIRFQCMSRDKSGYPRDYELTIKVNNTDDLKMAVQWVANNVPVAHWIQEQQARNGHEPAQVAVSVADPEPEEKSRVIEAMRLVRTEYEGNEGVKWLLYFLDDDEEYAVQGKYGAPTWDDFANQIRNIVPEQYRPNLQDGKKRSELAILPKEYHFKVFYTTPNKQRKSGEGSYKVTQFHRAETLKTQSAAVREQNQ